MLVGSIGIASLVGGSCTCSDRVVGDEPEGYGEPACIWLINPVGFYPDGSVRKITDDANGRSPTACLCLTEEEFASLGDRLARRPEDSPLLDEFNQAAYDECKRLAAVIGGFVDDECLDYYEEGLWLKDIYFAHGSWENGKPPGFTCIES